MTTTMERAIMKPTTTKRRRRRARGYSAIEVLMAMTVFAVGAAGVIAMQRASVQGNVDARRIDTANAIARDWIERVRRDSMLWTNSGNMSQTLFLSKPSYYGAWTMPNLIADPEQCPSATTGTFSNADGRCPAFDIMGRDLAQDRFVDAAFCANIRLDTAAADGGVTDLIRVDVRVYWPRQLTQAPNAPFSAAGKSFCDVGALSAANGPDGASGGPTIYHFVYASTLVRMSPVL